MKKKIISAVRTFWTFSLNDDATAGAPFAHLNVLYKEGGLQFDSYGNPIYLGALTK